MAKNGLKYTCSLNSSRCISNFSKILYFLPNKMVIHEEGGFEYVDKADAAKGGGLGNC